ncbi:hypothetical protein L1987_59079 [Smallanthus sonchifolius]|uniref:Uncharacterized protein n=1 Tax=Smallanthus sonchifolius TaxID=185202 RepID=A0ACB9D4B6_9ASTR|nr:hypothetical protein L1987_59079 [Smallanthus sonchifolius]
MRPVRSDGGIKIRNVHKSRCIEQSNVAYGAKERISIDKGLEFGKRLLLFCVNCSHCLPLFLSIHSPLLDLGLSIALTLSLQV